MRFDNNQFQINYYKLDVSYWNDPYLIISSTHRLSVQLTVTINMRSPANNAHLHEHAAPRWSKHFSRRISGTTSHTHSSQRGQPQTSWIHISALHHHTWEARNCRYEVGISWGLHNNIESKPLLFGALVTVLFRGLPGNVARHTNSYPLNNTNKVSACLVSH